MQAHPPPPLPFPNYFLSPLENQSYSNNPSADQGRANPVLPRSIQDRLEKVGLLVVASPDADPVKSSQAIDLKKQQVRNVVSFTIPSLLGQTRKASLTGTPHDIIIAVLLVHSKKIGPQSVSPPFSCSVPCSVGRLQTQYGRPEKSGRQVSRMQSGRQSFSNQYQHSAGNPWTDGLVEDWLY